MKDCISTPREEDGNEFQDAEESMAIFLEMVENGKLNGSSNRGKGVKMDTFFEVFGKNGKFVKIAKGGPGTPVHSFAAGIEATFIFCAEQISDLPDRVEELATSESAEFDELVDCSLGSVSDILVERLENISFELAQSVADTFEDAEEGFLRGIQTEDEESADIIVATINHGIRKAVFREAERLGIEKPMMEPALAALDGVTAPLAEALDTIIAEM
ncbi:MAG: hypothetical protein P1V20_08980 [Verrucomicrobiales bacterium]|nr:hypothetical protein [Verrucomicrobiales bacterium]